MTKNNNNGIVSQSEQFDRILDSFIEQAMAIYEEWLAIAEMK